MALFANTYRIESARMPSWDYGINAAYFVTICTINKEQRFGRIVNDEMQLSSLGIAANDCWLAIPEHFPFVILDIHIVMPNHVHGIIRINKPYAENIQHVETQDFASLQQHGNHFHSTIKNPGSIIREYKNRFYEESSKTST